MEYGLGTMIHESALGTAYGHEGFMPGYLTIQAYYPEVGIAGALQLNCDD